MNVDNLPNVSEFNSIVSLDTNSYDFTTKFSVNTNTINYTKATETRSIVKAIPALTMELSSETFGKLSTFIRTRWSTHTLCTVFLMF